MKCGRAAAARLSEPIALAFFTSGKARYRKQSEQFGSDGRRPERHAAIGIVEAHRGCVMSKTNEFWRYAKEAVLSADRAESAEERQALLDLAQTWTAAAMIERHAGLRVFITAPSAPPQARVASGFDRAAPPR